MSDAEARRTWDVPEHQDAVDFPDDAVFGYHVRFLFVRLPEAGKWIAGSCDLDLEVINLNDHHVIALPRNGLVPQRLVGNLYYQGDLGEAASGRCEGRSCYTCPGARSCGCWTGWGRSVVLRGSSSGAVLGTSASRRREQCSQDAYSGKCCLGGSSRRGVDLRRESHAERSGCLDSGEAERSWTRPSDDACE